MGRNVKNVSQSHLWWVDLLGGFMIFVTLGTQDKEFIRLLKIIDNGIEKGIIKEEVLAQTGYTNYKSKNFKTISFVDMERFEKIMEKCDLLITHGGVGSIISGLHHQKKIIAMARLKRYKEHTNDHQKQIIKKFVKDGYITELKNEKGLEEAIKEAKKKIVKPYKSNTENMINLIENYIKTH